MAQVQIDILASDKASPAIKQVNGALDDMNAATKQNSSATANMASVSLAAWIQIAEKIGATAKAIYDFAKQGAELQLVETRFRRLAESIGTTSEALMSDLRNATRGLYSDAELMASATDLMALGLAKTHDEAVRLASVSAGLNMNMNQLVLTLTNQTTMRFDALGVSVDGFKEKVKELEKAGLSANDAFNEAFLQQAEEQLNRVGHAADTNAGAFMRLESQMKNTRDASRSLMADAVAPFISYLADSTASINTNAAALKNIDDGLYRNYQAHKVLTPEMQSMIASAERWTTLADSYTQATNTSTAALQEQTKATAESSAANKEQLSVIERLQGTLDRYSERYQQITNDTSLSDDERIAKLRELESEYQLATRKIVLSLLEQKLAQDGLTDAELNFLLEKGQAWGIYSGTVVTEARKAIAEANNLANAINGIPESKTITLNVQTNYSPATQQAMTLFQQGEKGYIPTRGARASGGFVGAGRPYLVGEQGAELFVPSGNGQIVPNDQLGGGGMNITVVYSPAVSTASQAELQQILAPIITSAVRKGYVGGSLG